MTGFAHLLKWTRKMTSLINDQKQGRKRAFQRQPMRRANMRLEELEERIAPAFLGQQMFPADYPTNNSIANAPVSANSAAWISAMAATRNHLVVNWGAYTPGARDPNGNPSPLYSMPYNVVHSKDTVNYTMVKVYIDNYPGESDISGTDPTQGNRPYVLVPMPKVNPQSMFIEGDNQVGPDPTRFTGGGSDSHLIVWDADTDTAYEMWETSRPNESSAVPNGYYISTAIASQWNAANEVTWNMAADTFRTLGYTSGDAAGLPILNNIARPDEALSSAHGGQSAIPAIDHALRFTLPRGLISSQFTYPASHVAAGGGSIPYGARFRLRNDAATNALIAQMGPESQVIAHALQQYGLILADIGSSMFVQGAATSVNTNNNPIVDPTTGKPITWDMNDLTPDAASGPFTVGLDSIPTTDFEAVNLTPQVTSLSASSGPAGTLLTITGENFTGSGGHLSVLFVPPGNNPPYTSNGTTTTLNAGVVAASAVTVLDDQHIQVVVPSGLSGTVDIQVLSGQLLDDTYNGDFENATAPIFGYGISAQTASDQFTFSPVTAAVPSVTGISPASGPAVGSTTVTITGANFTGATGVFFGSTPATSFKVVSATTISANAPAGRAGQVVDVSVTTPSGTSATSTADQFSYSSTPAPTLTSISVTPDNPTATAGTSATFTATGTFSDNSTQVLTSGVTWSSTNQAVATVNGSGFANALAAGTTTITALDGGVSGSTTLIVAAAVPTVTGISPASGPATGGTTVTITGTNFTGATGVFFGGTAAASFKVVSATTISANAPAGTAGQVVDVSVTTAGGTSASSTADKFTYAAAATDPPPANLKATPGNGSVTFSFDPPTAAVVYYPYAELFNGTLYPIYVAFSNPFTITATNRGPLVNGQTYTFEVAITYADGQTSAWSNPVTVTVGGQGVAAPTISNVTPASGPVGGGTTVTIVGTNFNGATSVSFGGKAATSFTVVSTTKITAKDPAGTAGQVVDITVTTAGGTSATSSADKFNYVAKPVITTQPSNLTVTAGQSATFKVIASGTGLKYQWQRFVGGAWVNVSSSNTSSFTGATTASFTITSPAAGDAGNYRVVISNAGGTVTSKTVSLTVNAATPPTITTQPSSVTVTAGQPAMFTVVATGTGPLTYQWQKLIGGTWVNVSSSNTSSFIGANSATFSITSPVASDAGTYWVVVSNAAGTVDSIGVTLTVNSALIAPTIVTNPSDQTVAAGSTVMLTASAAGSPTPTVQWQVNTGSGFTDIPGATSTTYAFTAAASQNGDQFRAVFTNSAGQAITSAATLTISSGIVVGSGQTLEVKAGQTVSGVTVLPGGFLLVDAGGTDNGSLIAGGVESVQAGGQVIGTTVDEQGTTEGDLEVFGTGTNLVLNHGYINVDPGGVVTETTINGDIMYVDGIANNTIIKAGGSVTVIGPAGTDNGTILNGGTEWIRSGAVSNGTTVNNGGIEYVFAGGVANNLIVNNGGSATLIGTVAGATINNGGSITVGDGASATGAIVDNGRLEFDLSGTNTFGGQLTGNGTLAVQGTGKLVVSSVLNNSVADSIGNSSSLELMAAANSNITFGYQSTLRLDASQAFTGTLAATPGYEDVIDLGDLPFVQGVTTVQYVENTGHTQGVLTVSDQAVGGPTVQLTLFGDFSAGVFSITTDGMTSAQNPQPGTLIQGPF
jgi:autotransporter passenger strand-loop-strand repeat protein